MKTASALTFGLSVLFASLAVAQEPPAVPAPEKEHKWLEKFVGEWESESTAMMGPEQPEVKCQGSMSARMLGGYWLVADVQSDMAGMQVKALQTIGYDPEKKKFVATWVDSVCGYMWKCEGSVDESGKKLTLEAEGPNFMTQGKVCKFRDVYEFKSADHIVVTSSMQDDDGKWVTFMSGNARRKKAD